MKKIFLIILYTNFIFGQINLNGDAKYKLYISGYIGTCRDCCGDIYGLKNVTTKYANGSETFLFIGRKVNESILYESIYTKNNPISQVKYGIDIRWKTAIGCNGGPANRDKAYSITSCSYIKDSPGDGLSGVKIASRPSVTITPSTVPLYLSDNKDLTITLPDNIDNSYYQWKYKVADGIVKDFPSPFNLKSTLKITGKDFLSDSDDNKPVYVWLEMNCDAGEKLAEILVPGPDYSGCAQAIWVPVLDPWGEDRGDGYWEGENDIVCMNAADEIYNQQKQEIIRQYQSRTSNIINFTYKLSCPTISIVNISNIKCNGGTGSVDLAFDSELLEGKDFLFVVKDFATNIPIVNKIVPKSETVNLKYTFMDLKTGKYYIEYQAQSTGPDPKIGSTPLKTDGFTIESPELLKFTAIPIQPLCSTEKGSIEITTNGGTAPYYYILDYATENINGHVVPKKISISVPIQGLIEGNHNIKVVDSNGCIQTQE